jgi:hypothetical protein
MIIIITLWDRVFGNLVILLISILLSNLFHSNSNINILGKHTKQYVECSISDNAKSNNELRRDEYYTHDALSMFAKALDILYPQNLLRVMSEHDSM